MKAKEMFEKLGYKEQKFSNDVISYVFREGITREYITFYLEEKTFDKENNFGGTVITLNELKAINKQIEELGWK